MKPSLSAFLIAPAEHDGGDDAMDAAKQSPKAPGIRRVSFAAMRDVAVAQDLIPVDGTAVVVPGERFAQLMSMDKLEEIEARINGLRMEVKLASKQDKTAALQQGVLIAETSQHPHELSYLMAMFIHHKEVLRALAANKHLPEQDQRRLAQDPELAKDKGLQRVLASNPALTASVMRVMLAQTDDSLVQLEVAKNAAEQAAAIDAESDFAAISESLFSESYDRWVRVAAIQGVRDPELLRRIAATHDNVLGPSERAAVAANRNTPPEVLERMAKPTGIRRAMQGITQGAVPAVIARLAQQTLRARRSAEAPSTHYHSSPD